MNDLRVLKVRNGYLNLTAAYESLRRAKLEKRREKSMTTKTAVKKDVLAGDFHQVRDFDIAEIADRQTLEYANDPTSPAYRDAVARRLGDMNVVEFHPYRRKDFDVSGAAVAAPDPFLRGADMSTSPDLNESDRDDGMVSPAGFSAPRPGDVGGVPVPKVAVRKRTPSGLFSSAILGRHNDLADSFLA
jgi:hypothetical protein